MAALVDVPGFKPSVLYALSPLGLHRYPSAELAVTKYLRSEGMDGCVNGDLGRILVQKLGQEQRAMPRSENVGPIVIFSEP